MSAVRGYDLRGQCEAAVWRAESDDIFLFGDAVKSWVCSCDLGRDSEHLVFRGGISWER